MNAYSPFHLFKIFLVALLLISVTAACSNSASSDEEVHPEAVGFILKLSGDNIVEKYPNQTIINNFPEITEGDETALISVYFIDDEGNEFIPDEPEVSLDFEIGDPSIIEIEQHDGELWEFHVIGLAAGTSDLTLQLMHSGHPDFESPAITINVVPQASGNSNVVN